MGSDNENMGIGSLKNDMGKSQPDLAIECIVVSRGGCQGFVI